MSPSQNVARRLYVLDFGLFEVHDNGRVIGIPGYFIEAGDEARILVDAGFPPWYRDDPDAASREDGLGEFGRILKLDAENFPEAQLARIGVRPKDVTHLVVTHGDIDHVGFVHEFTHATIVVGEAERNAGPPRYFGGKSRMRWPKDATYRLIVEDTEIAPGVTVLPTPGHSVGHVSLRVRLPSTGTMILAADAINRAEELETGLNSGGSDQELALESTRRLLEMTRAEQAFLVYGHDPEQWNTLDKAPRFYC
jgi:N-acyl homoserine lactone hydrolase